MEPVTTTQPGAATNTSRQTTTTATDSNDATTTIEQWDNEEPTAEGEKELEMGGEKPDGTSERKADTGEREETTTNQSEPPRSDCAADSAEPYGPTPIESSA